MTPSPSHRVHLPPDHTEIQYGHGQSYPSWAFSYRWLYYRWLITFHSSVLRQKRTASYVCLPSYMKRLVWSYTPLVFLKIIMNACSFSLTCYMFAVGVGWCLCGCTMLRIYARHIFTEPHARLLSSLMFLDFQKVKQKKTGKKEKKTGNLISNILFTKCRTVTTHIDLEEYSTTVNT